MKLFGLWLMICLLLCPAAWARSAEIQEQTALQEIMDLPAFSSCAPYLFDREARSGRTALTLAQMRNRYAYFDPSLAAETLNTMAQRMEEGSLRWIPLYTDEECAADVSLQNAGLFFFEGEPQAPFAVICPGGGFEYVSSMTEGFPHALYLSCTGYHAFVLQYRTGMGQEKAFDDLRRALDMIFIHAEEWHIDTRGYSLWGASAGATVAAVVGDNPAGLPQPTAIVMQYIDTAAWTTEAPPTYGCVGQLDELVSWKTMEQRLEQMSSAGIDVEFHLFPHLHHGFGLGIGTEAEGWIEDAINFWNAQMAIVYAHGYFTT